MNICMGISFQLLWVNTKDHDCWIIWLEYVQFCKKLPNCLPRWLYYFAFLLIINQFLLLSPIFSGVSFWIVAILIDMQWYLITILTSISPMTYNMENLFIYLFSICVSSLIRYLFRSFPHFLIRLFVFLVLSLRFLCIVQVIVLYLMCLLQIFFSQSMAFFSFSFS